jgi:hypothetical protein
VSIEVEGGGAVDRLAGVAGGHDGEGTVPAGREQEDGVDIGAIRQATKAIANAGRPAVGYLGGPVGNGIANGADFEAVIQRPQGGRMPRFPRLAETDNADAKFHGRWMLDGRSWILGEEVSLAPQLPLLSSSSADDSL